MISKARMIKAERERAKRKAEEEKKKEEEEKAKKEKKEKEKKKKKKKKTSEETDEEQSSTKEESSEDVPGTGCEGCWRGQLLSVQCFRGAGRARAWPGLGCGPGWPGQCSHPCRESGPPHQEAQDRPDQSKLY